MEKAPNEGSRLCGHTAHPLYLCAAARLRTSWFLLRINRTDLKPSVSHLGLAHHSTPRFRIFSFWLLCCVFLLSILIQRFDMGMCFSLTVLHSGPWAVSPSTGPHSSLVQPLISTGRKNDHGLRQLPSTSAARRSSAEPVALRDHCTNHRSATTT